MATSIGIENSLLDYLNEIIFIADLHVGEILYANKAAEKTFGYNQQEINRLSLPTLCHKDKPEEWTSLIEKVRHTGELKQDCVYRDGQNRSLYLELQGHLIDWGEEKALLAIVRDVTESRRMEKLLKSSEEFYRTIIENSFQGLAIFDAGGTYTYVNPATTTILDRSEEELIGKSVFEIIHPDYIPSIRSILENLLENPGKLTTIRTLALKKNGQPTDVEVYAVNLLNNPVIHGIVAWFVALNDSVAHQRRVERQRKYFYKVINAIPAMVWARDWNGRFTLVNDAFCNMVGMTEKEIIGKTEEELGGNPILAEKYLEQDRAVMISAEPSAPYELATHDLPSDKSFWIRVYKAPLIMQDHIETVSVATDITDRKITEEQLRVANQELVAVNGELDRFIYSASHELRTPITSSLGMLQLMATETDFNSLQEYIPLLNRTLLRMDALVRKLNQFSRNEKNSITRDLIDFGSLVIEVMDKLRYAPRNQKVEFSCEIEQENPFYSDRRRLTQIIEHLLNNAVTYMDFEKSNHSIRISAKAEADSAIIQVSDNGIGIDAKYQDKIFDMFFRATAERSGTGLGLYVVRNLVEKLDGQIMVQSELGEGTTFTVLIPNIPEEPYLAQQPDVSEVA